MKLTQHETSTPAGATGHTLHWNPDCDSAFKHSRNIHKGIFHYFFCHQFGWKRDNPTKAQVGHPWPSIQGAAMIKLKRPTVTSMVVKMYTSGFLNQPLGLFCWAGLEFSWSDNLWSYKWYTCLCIYIYIHIIHIHIYMYIYFYMFNDSELYIIFLYRILHRWLNRI